MSLTKERTLGERLHDRREELGIGVRELSRMLAVSPAMIRQWEQDKNQPGLWRTPYIEDALNLDEGTIGQWARYCPRYLATIGDRTIPGYLNDLICALFPARTSSSPIAA